MHAIEDDQSTTPGTSTGQDLANNDEIMNIKKQMIKVAIEEEALLFGCRVRRNGRVLIDDMIKYLPGIQSMEEADIMAFSMEVNSPFDFTADEHTGLAAIRSPECRFEGYKEDDTTEEWLNKDDMSDGYIVEETQLSKLADELEQLKQRQPTGAPRQKRAKKAKMPSTNAIRRMFLSRSGSTCR